MIGYTQNEQNDLSVSSGDFEKGDVSQEIVSEIAHFLPGDNKALPSIGAGLRMALGGEPDVFFPGRLKKQALEFGIEIKKIAIVNHELIEIEL